MDFIIILIIISCVIYMNNRANYFSKHIDYKRKYLDLKLKGGENINKNINKNININKDGIKGVIWGVLAGDSLGTRYEFMESSEATIQLNKDLEINNKLQLLGGGPFNLKPGQISDDSEMTLCLLLSIIILKKYVQADVALNYIKWFKSSPVDIGLTISKSLKTRKESTNYKDMIENSNLLNLSSLSNGVLMRITPLAIYSLYISDTELKTYVNEECDLTHPNPIIKDASYIYCIAIKYLLLNKNRKDVYNMCVDLIKTPRLKIVLNDSNNRAEPIYLLTKDSNDKYVNTDDKQYQGYVGIALQNAFYELLHGNTFYESMLNIIRRGGDVDTNCSIAGGLLGAFYGYKNIEPDWIKLIKNTDRGVEFISPSQTDTYIEKLYKVIQSQ